MNVTEPLVIKRTLAASRERVFAMWTERDLVQRWFCPGATMTVPVADIDAREGGEYRIVMQDADGQTYSPSGHYEKVIPNELLVFTWKWADSDLVTRVTLAFHALSDAETELTLTHEGFTSAELATRHRTGWDGCLSRLTAAIVHSH
jgi:uncharacterized protein YndB with AHSA1/START domain